MHLCHLSFQNPWMARHESPFIMKHTTLLVNINIDKSSIFNSANNHNRFPAWPRREQMMGVLRTICSLPGDSNTVDGHDDVIKWKHFPRYWPFVRGIHRSPVNSPHKGQWRGALIFSLICAWINGWINIVRLVILDAIVPIMTSL